MKYLMNKQKQGPTKAKESHKKFGALKGSSRPHPLVAAMRMNRHQKNQVTAHPNDKAILFGRGGESNNNAGNRRYQKVIAEMASKYTLIPGRKEKTIFAWGIYQQLKNEGYHFLKRDSNGMYFEEASDAACRKKISQRLRERALEAKDSVRTPPAVHSRAEVAAVSPLEEVDPTPICDLATSSLELDDESLQSLLELSDELLDLCDTPSVTPPPVRRVSGASASPNEGNSAFEFNSIHRVSVASGCWNVDTVSPTMEPKMIMEPVVSYNLYSFPAPFQTPVGPSYYWMMNNSQRNCRAIL